MNTNKEIEPQQESVSDEDFERYLEETRIAMQNHNPTSFPAVPAFVRPLNLTREEISAALDRSAAGRDALDKQDAENNR